MIRNCRRILSHKQMRDARRALDFCYLCGEDLPAKGRPGRKKDLIAEHVIPRSVLGDPPQSADAWTVVLDVHRKCEQSTKQHADHWLKLLQEIHVKPPEEWADPGYVRSMTIRPSLLVDRQSGTAVPALEGLGELLDGVWCWIRGLHAALYEEFLPRDTPQFSHPPVPACSTQEGGPTIEQADVQSHLTRKSIGLAETLDKCDGVTAWCGALQYRCVWWQCAGLAGKADWICFWDLRFPSLMEWSRQVLPCGQKRPWHGSYARAARPKVAAWLASEDFPAGSSSEEPP